MDIGYLNFWLICLCIMFAIISLILIFRTKSEDIVQQYYRIYNYLEAKKEKNLIDLKYGDKEINEIEKEILNYKKMLGIKKFKNKNKK